MNKEPTAIDAYLGMIIALNNNQTYKVKLPTEDSDRSFRKKLDEHKIKYERGADHNFIIKP